MLAVNAKQGRPKKKPNTMLGSSLELLGLSYMQSSRWQLVASIPQDQFEKHIAETLASDKELTSAGVRKLAARQASPG